MKLAVVPQIFLTIASAANASNLRATPKYTLYVANTCDNNSVGIQVGHRSKIVAPNECQVLSDRISQDVVEYTETGNGAQQNKINCLGQGRSEQNMNQCDLLGMAENACVLTTSMCQPAAQPTPAPESTYTLYVANKCANNSVNILVGGIEKEFAANECKVFSSDSFLDWVHYSEIGAGNDELKNIHCGSEGAANVDQCNLSGMPENACVLTTTECEP